jgi:Barstar (barnase inhibitor)
MQPFVLTSDIASLASESARVVEVPLGLSDKNSLLSWYAGALGMPEYCGSNWDAFDECLRDLSWISEHRLVLYHRAVPLEASPKDQKIYVDVLASAVRDWKPGEAHELVVVFDPACELKLRQAARA